MIKFKMFEDGWVRHSIAVPSVTRTYTRLAKAKHWTKEDHASVNREVHEMVHANDVYRKKQPNGKPGRTLWHRGARVGVV